MLFRSPTLLAASLAATLALPTLAADADTEARLKALEARLNALEAENQLLKRQQKATEQRVDTVQEEAKPSGSAGWAENSRIGGYGELHYNNLDGEGGASDKEEIDLHRFVLFFGHQFNERTRFFSELELEHSISGEGKKGEIELEQAYVEFDLNTHQIGRAHV